MQIILTAGMHNNKLNTPLTFAMGDAGRATEVGRRVSRTPLAIGLTLLVLVVADGTRVALASEQVVVVAHVTWIF